MIDGVRYSIPGDFAQVDADGTIHLLGRGSVCINSGGEKIFPEEVEEALKTHAAVRDAVVVGIPHPTYGEQIVAVVELADGAAAPAEVELIEHVKERLASYKAPRRVRSWPPSGGPPTARSTTSATGRRRSRRWGGGGVGRSPAGLVPRCHMHIAPVDETHGDDEWRPFVEAQGFGHLVAAARRTAMSR